MSRKEVPRAGLVKAALAGKIANQEGARALRFGRYGAHLDSSRDSDIELVIETLSRGGDLDVGPCPVGHRCPFEGQDWKHV